MGLIKGLKGLAVVLPVIISNMSAIMSTGVGYNLLVQKSCCPGGPPANIDTFICPDSSILDNITSILTTKAGIQAVISAVCGLMFGFLRDLTGKSKILMYAGILGELVSTLASLASTYYWTSSPWILTMIQAFASGGCGESIMQMGALCILMAESSAAELPFRMQLYITSTLVTSMAGGVMSTVLVTSFGYIWLFTFCLALHLLALFLIIFIIKNKGYGRRSCQESVEATKKVFKWRENVAVLWLMLIALPTATNVLTGEALQHGKFIQLKFHYSLYQGQIAGIFGFSVAIVGAVLGPVILRRLFHCKELTIGIISCLADSAAAFLSAFINSEAMLYICSVAYFMKMAPLPIPTSVIKTIVDADELGTYLGINAILTSILPIGITRLYQEVSSMTIKTWPGAFYFVSTGCFLFLAVIFFISRIIYVEPQKPETTGSEEDITRTSENGMNISPDEFTKI